MKTHYRRISKTAMRQIKDLGEFGAVKVGTEKSGWIIVHVQGEDREGLPGKPTAIKNKKGITPHRFI